jgi:hypothetical protein
MLTVKLEKMIVVIFMEYVLGMPYIILVFLTLLIDDYYCYCYIIQKMLLKFMKFL